jgi:phage protein D
MSPADYYVPSFSIIVNGKKLQHGKSLEVVSVSVTDTANQADSFTFTIQDRHPQVGHFSGGPDLKWMDSGQFDEGSEVKISMGYVNKLEFMLRGEITAVSASFPSSGAPTLTVRGFCLYHQLQRRRRRKPFESSTDSGIAEEIASDMDFSLNAEVVTDVEYPLISSNDATYAAILTQRAQRFGYEVVVKDRTLYFQTPRYLNKPAPAVTLEWGKNLQNFSPSLSTYNMATSVKVRASQTARGQGKDPVVGEAKGSDIRVKLGPSTGPEIAESIFGKNPVLSDDHNIASQQEAKELAVAKLQTQAMEFISGRGACIGDPRLKARTVIKLKGLGQRFSGDYYVTSATHTIDAGGYRTSFEVKRNGR